MSYCVTASCLAHQRKVWLQGWGPDAGKWCHTDGWPCEPERQADREAAA